MDAKKTLIPPCCLQCHARFPDAKSADIEISNASQQNDVSDLPKTFCIPYRKRLDVHFTVRAAQFDMTRPKKGKLLDSKYSPFGKLDPSSVLPLLSCVSSAFPQRQGSISPPLCIVKCFDSSMEKQTKVGVSLAEIIIPCSRSLETLLGM